MHVLRVLRAAFILFSASWLTACVTPANPHSAETSSIDSRRFVSVEGTRFMLNDKSYYFAGTNFWYGAYLGAPGELGDRKRLQQELDLLSARGITNLRVLAASEQTQLMRAVRPAMVLGAGDYNQPLLEGLDYLLAEMAKRDMKAVLYFSNFWQWSGGMSQYVAWFTDSPVVDPDVTGEWPAFMNNSARFYRLPAAQKMYRDVIHNIITRTNSITGVPYNADPTIMSWQLANEPRPGDGETGRMHFESFKQWIHDTAKYIHSLAPNQLVSTGNEGARGTLDDMSLYIDAHSSPYVDYLTFHMWLKNWSWLDITRPEQTLEQAMSKAYAYIDEHIQIADSINKPIVLSEFGVERDQGAFEPETTVQYRDRIFSAIYQKLFQQAAAGTALAGSNFWSWGGLGRSSRPDFMWQTGDDFVGDPPQEPQGLNSVFDSDMSTLDIIQRHARKMQALSDSPMVQP